MATKGLTAATLDGAAAALAGKGPVRMVNLLRYRPQAEYADVAAGECDTTACSGREAYLQRYAPAFNRVAARAAPGEKVTVAMVGVVQATLVAAPGQAWDDVVIVEYSTFDVLRRILASPAYESEAAPHHQAALADWGFLATTVAAVPT